MPRTEPLDRQVSKVDRVWPLAGLHLVHVPSIAKEGIPIVTSREIVFRLRCSQFHRFTETRQPDWPSVESSQHMTQFASVFQFALEANESNRTFGNLQYREFVRQDHLTHLLHDFIVGDGFASDGIREGHGNIELGRRLEVQTMR